ncbi:MAG: thioredoxin family protein [Parachlamydiaceae bacterium]|nr:thioredoxin family protein [Parachlamydiaceae bacterium]
MRNSLVACFVFLTSLLNMSQVQASQINWLTNYDEAVKQSRSLSKPIVLFFTGSDWCGWCIKLENESLGTNEFAETAGDKFIFVKLDFPLNSKQSPEITAQNKRLQRQFDVTGYPTIVILDSKQQKIGTTGYRPGGGKQYGLYLLKTVDDHTAYEQKLETLEKQPLAGCDLRSLYNQATALSRDQDAHYIASVGLDSDQKHFFLLERYRTLSEKGLGHEDTAQALRQQLLASDPQNLKLTHYQLAVIDFDAACQESQQSSPDKAVAALVDYIQKFGDKDRDNLWRLQMLVAQVYFENDQLAQALRYAQSSYQAAPPAAQPEIATAIQGIEAKGTLSP